ncbi:hypothetical protein SK128_026843, partial [Halocaridina rubra]
MVRYGVLADQNACSNAEDETGGKSTNIFARSSNSPKKSLKCLVTHLSCLLIICATADAIVNSVTQISFQEDGPVSNSTFLKYLGIFPELTQLTICFRMYLLQARQEIAVISYSQRDFDNELSIGFDYERQVLMLACCNRSWFMDAKANVYLRHWTSLCITMDHMNRRHEVTQDSILIAGRNDDGLTTQMTKIRGGGQLYIGQEQDTHGGGFNEFQSFRGFLVDLRIYDHVLSSSELSRYTTCQMMDTTTLPIVDFDDIYSQFTISHAEHEVGITKAFCNDKEYVNLVFPERRLFREGDLLCRTVGGNMKVPRNAEDNRKLYEMSKPHAKTCGESLADTLWLGVMGNTTSGKWYDISNKKEPFFRNFDRNGGGQVEEPQLCVAFKGSTDIVESAFAVWVPRKCDLERCVACHFTVLPFVRIRGLCGKSEFDRRYFLVSSENGVDFVGLYYSIIVKHQPQSNISSSGDFGNWTMIRLDKPSIKATLRMKSPTHYPTGLNNWEVENDICGQKEVQLRMTSCSDQQFSCNDGTCIPLPKRCNMEANCEDGSDEIDCNFLVLPEGYDNKTPPPRHDPSSPVNVSLHVTMFSVRSFDITGFKFVCEMEVRLSWNDTRLKFHHLNEADSLNTIHLEEENKPWMPTVEYLGDAYTTSDIQERRSFLIAHRATVPLSDDDQRLVE